MVNYYRFLCSWVGYFRRGEKNNRKRTKKEPEKYSYEYCRENLKAGYYTDWNCHDISKQLQDNWVKDDVEYLTRNGLSFEYAIDEMMEEGKIKL